MIGRHATLHDQATVTKVTYGLHECKPHSHASPHPLTTSVHPLCTVVHINMQSTTIDNEKDSKNYLDQESQLRLGVF